MYHQEMADGDDSSLPYAIGLIAGTLILAALASVYWVWGKPNRGKAASRSSSADAPMSSSESKGTTMPQQQRRLRQDGRVQHSEEIDLRNDTRMAFERALLRPGQHFGGSADLDDEYPPRRLYSERPMPAEEAPAFLTRRAPSASAYRAADVSRPFSTEPALGTESATPQQSGGSPARPVFMTPPTRVQTAAASWSSSPQDTASMEVVVDHEDLSGQNRKRLIIDEEGHGRAQNGTQLSQKKQRVTSPAAGSSPMTVSGVTTPISRPKRRISPSKTGSPSEETATKRNKPTEQRESAPRVVKRKAQNGSPERKLRISETETFVPKKRRDVEESPQSTAKQTHQALYPSLDDEMDAASYESKKTRTPAPLRPLRGSASSMEVVTSPTSPAASQFKVAAHVGTPVQATTTTAAVHHVAPSTPPRTVESLLAAAPQSSIKNTPRHRVALTPRDKEKAKGTNLSPLFGALGGRKKPLVFSDDEDDEDKAEKRYEAISQAAERKLEDKRRREEEEQKAKQNKPPRQISLSGVLPPPPKPEPSPSLALSLSTSSMPFSMPAPAPIAQAQPPPTAAFTVPTTTTTPAASTAFFGAQAPAPASAQPAAASSAVMGGFSAPAPSVGFTAPTTATPSFGTPSSTAPIAFGAPATAAATTAAPAAFGSSSTPSFSAAPPQTGGPSFGSAPASSATTSFGAPFGAASTPSTTPAFGAASAPSSSAFGASTTGSSFGATAPAFGTASAPSSSAFGSSTSVGFGAPTSAPASTPFGSSTPSSTAFGSASAPTPTTSFGASTTPAFGSSSGMASTTGAFGTAPSGPAFSAPSSSSSFGAAPAFGAASSSAPSSAFGASSSTSAPQFGASAPAFGAPASSTTAPAAFGSSTFAAPTSSFGAATSAPSPFGSSTTSSFGASSSSAFGQPAPTGAFGATSSGSSFGASASAFGSSGASTPFSAPAPSGAFGSRSAPAPSTVDDSSALGAALLEASGGSSGARKPPVRGRRRGK